MSDPQYLRRVEDGMIFPWTPVLAGKIGKFVVATPQEARDQYMGVAPKPVVETPPTDTVTMATLDDQPEEPTVTKFEKAPDFTPPPEASETPEAPVEAPVEMEADVKAQESEQKELIEARREALLDAVKKIETREELCELIKPYGIDNPDGRKSIASQRRSVSYRIRNLDDEVLS